ncbi:MAG: NAD(P)-dependent malic enzyme [Bacteroidales bacterium]|jgi:malate dehydrogenase (oxaloacetate-decarboxylating)|nr:NADP-dependent malic enzyme [Bacteroidales bacterium]
MDISLNDIDKMLPDYLNEEDKARCKTLFLKHLSEKAHRFYGGKVQTVPKAPVPGFNWFNVWYTPGVSQVSTDIRDNNEASFSLSNRGNLVAVVSDSTRVLGDGDCTPPGGLGVMEGKAYLMKHLGGVDAVALCIDSKDETGKNNPDKIIDFVKMVQHSFGAVNLEDISQPNCYKVLDVLRETCDIPVWHDDAQGTACVTLAALINALKLAKKDIKEVKVVLYGAGASNTTIARLLMMEGVNPLNMIMFDNSGTLHREREDLKNDERFAVKWNLSQKTNPDCITEVDEAFKDADVLIALSAPGPDTIKPEWIKLMADKAIVFTCANPIPEIYPHAAKAAGAYIVATGRGDFPNQVNNSVGFPGILKGTLLVRAKKITDNMAIAAAHSLAKFAESRGINPENIIPSMDEIDVFPHEAADVAMQAIKDGVARLEMTWQEAYDKAKEDIEYSQKLTQVLTDQGLIKMPPAEMIEESLNWAIEQIKG